MDINHVAPFFSREMLDKITSNHFPEISDCISNDYEWAVFGNGEYFDMGALPMEVPHIIHGGSANGYKSMPVTIIKGGVDYHNAGEFRNQTVEVTLVHKIVQIPNKNPYQQ
ncbi:hypothetical protein [Fodinibius sediminis]|uniref:Uncharacterized protein n=1 Tax=Fodinibius sediminis TaxID=1214077 RepID=A0A521E5Y3_9BACT|nr:hypothetical protein [Fodinibius sediminis]SMO79348.1 hypothetical protein SAMN06265218_113124 [Fodinibius sediminis]